jgi:hypothetical protein
MASSTAHLLKWKVDMPPEPRGAPRHPNFVNASWRRPGDKIAEKAAFNEALAEFHQNRGYVFGEWAVLQLVLVFAVQTAVFFPWNLCCKI